MAEAKRIKPMKRLGYTVQYGLLRGIVALSRLAGLDRASAAGGWFGRNVMAPLQRNNPTVTRMIATAFPEKTAAERAEIAAGMWDNLGRVTAELAHLDRMDADELARRVKIIGREHLDGAVAKGTGFIVISGHFANWELGLPLFAKLFRMRSAIVMRTPNNRGVARWIAATRDGAGAAEQIEKGPAGLRRMFATLRRGDAVMMLVDQHFAEGVPVPFFGRPTMTTTAPAMLARKVGVPLVGFGFRRTEGAYFELEFYPEFDVPHSDNADRDAAETTAAVNAAFESTIRRAPSQWLWGHARWRDTDGLSRRALRAGISDQGLEGR
jgi:Kdo2-lipid IVA lauroyltransferase/acyltransferase